MRRLLPVIVVSLLLSASCTEKAKPGLAREVVTGVTLAKLQPSDIDSSYETSGTVAAKTVSVIGARTMGTVIAMKVREGDRVSQGQELVVLDDRDLAARVSAAESGYRESLKALEEAEQNRRLAGITFGRYKNLFDEKVISGQEMDQVETQKRVADLGCERALEAVSRFRAQLEEVKINRGFTRVVAPHDGVITGKKTDQGSMAAPGSPLLILEDTSRYRVEAFIDQRMSPLVKVGMPVVVLFPSDGRRVPGSITEVVPAVDQATRSFLIRIDAKDSVLRSGLYVKVLIPEGKKRALLVHRNAVVEKGQLTGVYVVDGQGVMTYRMVRVGRAFGDRVELLSGAREGEIIAVAGLEKAIDGGVVKQPIQGRTNG